MNDKCEWKILNAENIPSDILVGDYESHEGYPDLNSFPEPPTKSAYQVIGYAIEKLKKPLSVHSFYYRKIMPKAPSHEEIMKLWWEIEEGIWLKVTMYNNGVMNGPGEAKYKINNKILRRYNFTGLKSAPIPPEETK